MKPHIDNVVERPADLTADWLTAADRRRQLSLISVSSASAPVR